MAKMKTSTVVGLAAVAIGAWWLLGRGGAVPQATDKVAAPRTRPFGDPGDMQSVAYACNTAWKLTRLGHPIEARAWAATCASGGGRVPTSDPEQYT